MKIGEQVVVTDPDSFIAEVRDKVKAGRVGEVLRVRDDGYALVVFPSIGRRKEFKHAFRFSFLAPVEPAPGPSHKPKM